MVANRTANDSTKRPRFIMHRRQSLTCAAWSKPLAGGADNIERQSKEEEKQFHPSECTDTSWDQRGRYQADGSVKFHARTTKSPSRKSSTICIKGRLEGIAARLDAVIEQSYVTHPLITVGE